jgi:hypothetical protein
MAVLADRGAKRPGFWARLEDGAIIRAAFYALLAGTVGVLSVDYYELSAANAALGPDRPILPSSLPAAPGFAPDQRVTTDPSVLSAPLTIELTAGGVLALTGTIDLGSAERFLSEVEARGEYVTTVRLDSPGGSVRDALAIGQTLRDRGLSTSVAAGALCASSCPLILASGVERLVSSDAAVGVHQIYPSAMTGTPVDIDGLRAAGSAMSDAQTVTAQISRHLDAMGIASGVWLHALETPPNRLYYFSDAELVDLKLATAIEK